MSQMNLKETHAHTLESEPETFASMVYETGREHLQVLRLRDGHSHNGVDEFAGLYIKEEEIDKVLKPASRSQGRRASSTKDSEITALLNRVKNLRAKLSEGVEESLTCGISLPLYQLSYLFQLTPFELDTILICLAPELDLKYEKLYAYLLSFGLF